MDAGEKCICQEEEWFNAFGPGTYKLVLGQRLTVRDTRRVAGARFLAFKEVEGEHWFMDSGFKPMRSLN